MKAAKFRQEPCRFPRKGSGKRFVNQSMKREQVNESHHSLTSGLFTNSHVHSCSQYQTVTCHAFIGSDSLHQDQAQPPTCSSISGPPSPPGAPPLNQSDKNGKTVANTVHTQEEHKARERKRRMREQILFHSHL